MKKFYMILAAIAALTMTAQAQNFATCNIGDLDNATIYNGSYFDMAPTNFYVAHTGVQMLYTPDLLTEMDGKQNVLIKSLDFWFANEAYEEIFRNVKIYLQETDATEFAVDEEGVKQFFEFGEPVKEMEFNIDLLNYFYEDVNLNFDFEPFAFTPGKSLLITMVFDAVDDDNCTQGSDYAAFYTSGIRGKAMSYTNNWNSFVDFAQGPDFPDATVMLGCGTNVELPVTKIGFNYEDAPEPPTPAEGIVLVIVDQDNVEHAFNLTKGEDGDFSTTVTLDYVPYGQFYWDPALSYAENDANRPAVPFYFLIDGKRYGAEGMRETVLGFAMQNPLDSELDGFYTVPVGFSYTLGVAQRDGVNYVYAAVSTPTGVDELNVNKTVAGVHYFNAMGQEMQEANGMTIVVTTYTDGTTSTVKVMK